MRGIARYASDSAISKYADERVLVYHPYTWGASDYDTGNRLAAAANRLVIASDGTSYALDFVASHMPGTGRVRVDKATRSQLATSKSAAQLATDHVELLIESGVFDGYEAVVAAGVSGRSTPVARAVLGLLQSDRSRQPFTHVFTVDGFNIDAPHPSEFAIVKGCWRLARLAGKQETTFSVPHAAGRRRNPLLDARAVSYKFAESCALGPLYQLTAETKVALRDLAAQTEIPYMSIGFTKGISGSGEQVEAFGRELAEIHRVGLMANNGTGAPFRPLVQPLAHGDLLNPDVTAGHVAFTLALTEANLREGFDLFPLA